jgi:type III secretory pathway component EscS
MSNKISEKTSKFIEKNLKEKSTRTVEQEIVREDQSRKDLSKFILLVGIIGPVLALFQAFTIFSKQTVSGVSMIYWGAYLIIAGLWLGYGIYTHNRNVSIAYGTWVFVIIIILNGFYFYG